LQFILEHMLVFLKTCKTVFLGGVFFFTAATV